MAEYIEKDALIKWIESRKRLSKLETILMIQDAPTALLRDVVRCKDCKNNGECSIQDAMNWTPRTEIGDYFCSYGERKDNPFCFSS